MRIDPSRCVACGNCVAVCPMGAIAVDQALGRAVVNEDECVECYACYRGMSQEHLPPALVRAVRRAARASRTRSPGRPPPSGSAVPGSSSRRRRRRVRTS